MSAFPESTIAAYQEHLEAKLAYATLLGVDEKDLSCSRTDDQFLSFRQKALMRMEFLIAKENINAVDASAAVGAMLVTVLFVLTGLHDLVGWWLLAVMLTGIFVGAYLFRRNAESRFTPALQELLEARSASERTYSEFVASVGSSLKSCGLNVKDDRPGYRYVTDYGVATLVTINGELDFLLNGKVVQQPYREIYAV